MGWVSRMANQKRAGEYFVLGESGSRHDQSLAKRATWSRKRRLRGRTGQKGLRRGRKSLFEEGRKRSRLGRGSFGPHSGLKEVKRD